jgi:zinc transport system substrate-binding protein
MRQYLLIILLLIGTFACTSSNKVDNKPVVAVSILPQKYLVEAIADTLVKIVVMVPPGASPATWEATPAQMQSLDKALVYFRIGHIAFENAWLPKIHEIYPQLQIVDLSSEMTLRHIDFQHGDHNHTGVDPHNWMSPTKMEEMARKVYNELTQLFPEQKTYFRDNYSKLMLEIKGVGAYASRTLKPYEGKTFLIFHPSIGYLADEYGLIMESIELEGKEPSPAHMKEVIDLARDKDIKLIFVQQEFDKRNAQLISEEIGANIVTIDPLSENWARETKFICDQLKKSFQ